MKNLLLIFLFSFLCLHLHAQQPDTVTAATRDSIRIQIDNPNRVMSLSNPPLFILRASGKTYTLPRGNNELSEIDPAWIESIDVIKGQSALDQYGTEGQYGVILVHLKKESLKKLPSSLRKELKGKD